MNPLEAYGLTPYGPSPNSRQMEWYRREKTAFLHFTVNTFTDREWGDGTESPTVFAPTDLDCRQWARVLKEGGFDAAILTAKHHDGFCLWPSRLTDHTVAHSPLAGRDIVREFTDACREYGIKPGLYLSPWDRHEPTWGKPEYDEFYVGQLKELLTNYGSIWEIWWDGAGSETAHYDWQRWVDLVHTLQPQCVIFGCRGAGPLADLRWVGNEEGFAGESCFATIDPQSIVAENCRELNEGKWGGSHFIPAETNTSIRPGWLWHERQNGDVRDVEELKDYWFRSAGRNSGILLNLPPDRRGLIHETDAANIRAWNLELQRMFREDLAQGATVTAPGGLHPQCGPDNLLKGEESAVYAAPELLPTVELTFEAPITFDCLVAQEVIELGHRVKSFRVDVAENGAWKTLLTFGCMGFRQARYFPPVTTRGVRLVITEAGDKPVLRRLSLYRTGMTGREARCEAREYTGLQIQKTGDGLLVNLGGIFPYNAVELDVPGAWRVESFNGTDFVFTAESQSSRAVFPTVTGSYQLRLTSDTDLTHAHVRVFLE